jgi:putative ABC transport system permease protein
LAEFRGQFLGAHRAIFLEDLPGSLLALLGDIVDGDQLAGRLFSRMLFGISPADPVSLAAAAGVLLAVACIACYLPARSATRIDPMIALRDL